MPVDDVSARAKNYECPRCGRTVEESFYGPCEACRADLRARFAIDGRVIEVGSFEPKLTVTPNAVALRDDD